MLTTQPLSSAEIKDRVQLYLFSPSGPSWPVPGQTLTSTLTRSIHQFRTAGNLFNVMASWDRRTVPRNGAALLCRTTTRGHRYHRVIWRRGAQIPSLSSRWSLNFAPWCLLFVGLSYDTCFRSPFWRLEFLCVSEIRASLLYAIWMQHSLLPFCLVFF